MNQEIEISRNVIDQVGDDYTFKRNTNRMTNKSVDLNMIIIKFIFQIFNITLVT